MEGKPVMLVVLAALSDGRKTVVSVSTGYRESTESWSQVLRDLKARGMNCPRLVIADGHLGIRSRRAALLESPDCQPTFQSPEEMAQVGPLDVTPDSLR
jgi:transposase-like protein